MSNIRITVDGTVLMDGESGQWTSTPPDIDAVKARGANQPWMMTIMTTIAEAAVRAHTGQPHRDTTITVTTGPEEDDWAMTVQHPTT